MATTKLTSATKYKIAEALASSYAGVQVPEKGTNSYKYYFAKILNESQFSVKGKTYTLKQFCKVEDDYLHITNLVLSKLSSPALVQRTVATIE